MIARKLTMKLKPNMAPEFKTTLEKKILPMLRKHEGFKDEITGVMPNGNEVFAVSLWEKKEHMDTYIRDTYPQVTKALEPLFEAAPEVKTFDVTSATFYRIGVPA